MKLFFEIDATLKFNFINRPPNVPGVARKNYLGHLHTPIIEVCISLELSMDAPVSMELSQEVWPLEGTKQT